MNNALAVFVIGPVDLIDFPHVRLERVLSQHFPVVVDDTLQSVLGGAQQLRPRDHTLVRIIIPNIPRRAYPGIPEGVRILPS